MQFCNHGLNKLIYFGPFKSGCSFKRESSGSAIESGINELQKQLVAELQSGVDWFPAFLLKIFEQMEAIVSGIIQILWF